MGCPKTVLVVRRADDIALALGAVKGDGSVFPLPLCLAPSSPFGPAAGRLIDERNLRLVELGGRGNSEPTSPGPLRPATWPSRNVLHTCIAPTGSLADAIAERYCAVRERAYLRVDSPDDLVDALGRDNSFDSLVLWGLTRDFPLTRVQETEAALRPQAPPGRLAYMTATDPEHLLYLAFKNLLLLLDGPFEDNDGYLVDPGMEGRYADRLPDLAIPPKKPERVADRRYGLVSTTSHSRSYEVQLFADHEKVVTLCNRSNRDPFSGCSSLGPICSQDGTCYRERAFGDRHVLIPVGDVRADVLFINSCGSWRLGPSDIGDGQSIGVTSNHGTAAAFVGSRYTHIGSPDMSLLVMAAWRSGCDLGDVLESINSWDSPSYSVEHRVPRLMSERKPRVHAYSLIGDPELRRTAELGYEPEAWADVDISAAAPDCVPVFERLDSATIQVGRSADGSFPIGLDYKTTSGSSGRLTLLGADREGRAFWRADEHEDASRTPSTNRSKLHSPTLGEQELTVAHLGLADLDESWPGNDHVLAAVRAGREVQASYKKKHWALAVQTPPSLQLWSDKRSLRGSCPGCGLETVHEDVGALLRDGYTERFFPPGRIFERTCPKCYQVLYSCDGVELSIDARDRCAAHQPLRVKVTCTDASDAVVFLAVYYSEVAPQELPDDDWPEPRLVQGGRVTLDLPDGLTRSGIAYLRVYWIRDETLRLSVASCQIQVLPTH